MKDPHNLAFFPTLFITQILSTHDSEIRFQIRYADLYKSINFDAFGSILRALSSYCIFWWRECKRDESIAIKMLSTRMWGFCVITFVTDRKLINIEFFPQNARLNICVLMIDGFLWATEDKK